MKTILVILSATCLAVGAWLLLPRTKSPANKTENFHVTPVAQEDDSKAHAAVREDAAPPASADIQRKPVSNLHRSVPQLAENTGSLPFKQALTTLTALESTYEKKQAAWHQLKSSGQLDKAIAELEQQAVSNPTAAEFPAALGQAYLQKAGTLSDIREQGILGMKADQSFDAALNVDPNNWEAGFWKATAMSYWPPQLGKGTEVIERFVNLIKVQETQPLQPQYAQTYLLLGEQYQRQGYNQYAQQAWQRGAALFPSEGKFAEKLAQPPAQTAAR